MLHAGQPGKFEHGLLPPGLQRTAPEILAVVADPRKPKIAEPAGVRLILSRNPSDVITRLPAIRPVDKTGASESAGKRNRFCPHFRGARRAECLPENGL